MDLTSTAEFNYDRLLELAKQGSNETVEVRAKVASARKLADLIASFAHQQGGFIIFGYNTRKRKILGCRMAKLQRRFEEAVKMLGDMRFSTVSFQYSLNHRRPLGVVYVPAVNRLIESPGGLVVRIQTSTRSMPRSRILQIIQNTDAPISLADLATMILRIQENANTIAKRLAEEYLLRNKLKNHVLGAAVGSAVTFLLGLVWTLFRK